MKSCNDTQTLPKVSSEGISERPLILKIRGLSNPISFKNSKCIWKRRNGKPFIATEPRFKTWMQRAAQLIASQLSSESAIRGFGTTPECLKRFAMSSLPHDDRWLALEIGSVRTILVPKGEEGCDMIIERIPDISPTEAAAVYARTYSEVIKEKA